MKKFIILMASALLLILAENFLLYAQDLSFDSINPVPSGVGNQGLTGASLKSNFLNTALADGHGLQPNQLPAFNAIDTAVTDFNADGRADIMALSADDTNMSARIHYVDIGIMNVMPSTGLCRVQSENGYEMRVKSVCNSS